MAATRDRERDRRKKEERCYVLAKQLSQYLLFFSIFYFYFYFFSFPIILFVFFLFSFSHIEMHEILARVRVSICV